MIEPRHYLADSKAMLERIAGRIASLEVSPRQRAEIIIRQFNPGPRERQRNLLHAVLTDIGKQIGLTKAEVKDLVKRDYYGVEHKTVRIFAGKDKLGRRRWRKVKVQAEMPSTEDEDPEGYGRLIDFTYQWAAEREILISDRRPISR